MSVLACILFESMRFIKKFNKVNPVFYGEKGWDIGDDLEISVIPVGNPLLLPPFLPGYLGAVSEKKIGGSLGSDQVNLLIFNLFLPKYRCYHKNGMFFRAKWL